MMSSTGQNKRLMSDGLQPLQYLYLIRTNANEPVSCVHVMGHIQAVILRIQSVLLKIQSVILKVRAVSKPTQNPFDKA